MPRWLALRSRALLIAQARAGARGVALLALAVPAALVGVAHARRRSDCRGVNISPKRPSTRVRPPELEGYLRRARTHRPGRGVAGLGPCASLPRALVCS